MRSLWPSRSPGDRATPPLAIRGQQLVDEESNQRDDGEAAALLAGPRGLLHGTANGLDRPNLVLSALQVSVTADAISLTARPVSSDVEAICWEADDTELAFADSSPTAR